MASHGSGVPPQDRPHPGGTFCHAAPKVPIPPERFLLSRRATTVGRTNFTARLNDSPPHRLRRLRRLGGDLGIPTADPTPPKPLPNPRRLPPTSSGVLGPLRPWVRPAPVRARRAPGQSACPRNPPRPSRALCLCPCSLLFGPEPGDFERVPFPRRLAAARVRALAAAPGLGGRAVLLGICLIRNSVIQSLYQSVLRSCSQR